MDDIRQPRWWHRSRNVPLNQRNDSAIVLVAVLADATRTVGSIILGTNQKSAGFRKLFLGLRSTGVPESAVQNGRNVRTRRFTISPEPSQLLH